MADHKKCPVCGRVEDSVLRADCAKTMAEKSMELSGMLERLTTMNDQKQTHIKGKMDTLLTVQKVFPTDANVVITEEHGEIVFIGSVEQAVNLSNAILRAAGAINSKRRGL